MADINIGTPEAPLYVPEGSPGAQNYTQNIKTLEYIPERDGIAQSVTLPGNPNQQVKTVPLTMDQLTTATPITVPSQTPTVNPLEATAASATATTKSLDQYIKELTPPETETSKAVDEKTKEIEGLLPGLQGRGQAQLDAETAAGLPDLKKKLADLNSQILMKVAEATKTNASYEQLIAQQEGKGMTTDIVTAKQGAIRRTQLAEANSKAADLLLLQAVASGLSGNIQAAQSNIDRAIDLRYADRSDTINIKMQQLALLEGKLNKEQEIVAKALERKYQDEQRIIEDRKAQEKIVQNMAIEAAAKGADSATIKAIGASNNPIAAATSYAQFVKTQNNLANLKNYTITSPYVLTEGGEIQDTQSGYGFTSEEDFEQKTGMTIEQAVAKKLVKPLGLSKAEQQQNFENTITTENLKINRAQLGVSQYNAQTSRINATKPTSSIVELSDGTKSVVTIDNNGKVISQQPLESGSNGKAELQLARSQDNIASVSNLLGDKALKSAVGPIAAARGGFTLPLIKLKIPTSTQSFSGASQNFVAGVEQLRSSLDLETLIGAKARGATFGALSEGELRVLSNSATKIGSWAVKDSNGQVTGYNANEKDFKNELQKINNFAKLDYIIKGGDPSQVGVRIENDGSLTTINWDGSVTQLLK